MSSWWGCGLRVVLFHESSFSSFLKYTKLSAAQSSILAMLITSCSQTNHRHSGLPNKIIQMHSIRSQDLCVLTLFFHITEHRWEQEKCSVVATLIFLRLWLEKDKRQVEQVQTSKDIRFQIMFYRFMYITKIVLWFLIPTNCHQNIFFLHLHLSRNKYT